MKKKILKYACYILGVILVSALLAGGAIYLFMNRNVATTENVLGVSWYNETDKEFTIDTADELYELAKLSTYYNFKGQTIKLGADVVINEGNAEDWEQSAPSRKWTPINGFAGTFDGQGHTISGLYAKVYNVPIALFTNATRECRIQNFKLTNSYFEGRGFGGVASIVSSGGGSLKQIYSDARINVTGAYSGYAAGICSKLNVTTNIEECWFDGVITNTGRDTGGIVDDVIGSMVTLKHCLFSGEIHGTWDYSGTRLGGLVGRTVKDGAILNMEDCLSSGTITANAFAYTGGVLGTAMGGTVLKCKDVFGTSGKYAVIGTSGDKGDMQSVPLEMSADNLVGYKAYQWTSLDFENYWSVVEDGTPILTCFAENTPSLDGIEKAYDISWYDENASEGVITTLKQLYGFYLLSGNTNYEGKTVKLGADIVINEGKVKDWSKNAPENAWYSMTGFAGSFDGQGHTISGMYLNATKRYVGFFGTTVPGSTVKNLRLKNSLVVNMWGDTRALSTGSIAGVAHGTFENIYSDATMETAGYYMGGLFGQVYKETTISNCWYDGKITHTGRYAGGVVGFVSGSTVKVEHCLNTGTIDIIWENGFCNSGGIVGATMTNDDIVLNITDCLNVGTLTAEKGGLGSVLGHCVTGTVTIKDTYALKGSNTKDGKGVGHNQATVKGGVITLNKELLTGYSAFDWSTLDFDKYWSVVLGGTPILKNFASSSPSVAGRKKAFDISWYKEDANSFTIKNQRQLYGFYLLSATTDFKGKTIKLGADISINTGDANTWTAESSPANAWYPIDGFAGTFDGQGHTISGIYIKGDARYVGFFAKTTADAVVKNLRMENSKIINHLGGTSLLTTGSIAGGGLGTFDTIYSNAIVETSGDCSGGLIGQVYKNTTIKNCQYDGTLTNVGRYSGGIVGAVTGEKVNIDNCLNTGTIHVTREKGYVQTGGILGGTYYKDDLVVNITDCFNSGDIVTNQGGTGSILGHCVKGTVNIKNTYATSESNTKDKKSVGHVQGVVNGNVIQFPEYMMLGIDGYRCTLLDFDKYWAAVADTTPQLKSFTSGALSVAGVEKLYDTSWYDANKSVYTLTDVQDLYGLTILSMNTDFNGKTIKLGATITLNDGDADTFETTPPKQAWLPISKFAGTFDGQGNSIKGLYVPSGNKVGLFSETTKTAVIKNLKLEEAYICGTTSGTGTGSIVGRGGGTFSAIYSDAIVKSEYNSVGGIIGYINADTTMELVQFAGSATGKNQVGGFAANVKGADVTFTNCHMSGTVATIATSGHMNAGMFVGMIDANSDVAAIKSLAIGYLKPSIVSSGNYARVFVGKVTGNDALFHCESVYCVNDTNYIDSANQGLIGILNPKKDGQSTYTNCGWKGTAGSGIKRLSIAQMTGANAMYNINGIEFCDNAADTSKPWATIIDDTPMLRIFANASQVVDLTEYVVADTTWYTEAAKGVGSSEDNPYIIEDANDLLGLSELVNAGNPFAGCYFKVVKEIVYNTDAPATLEEWKNYTPKNLFTPIGTEATNKRFAGIFDGDGHTISGIYVSMTNNQRFVGLFGATESSAEIKNLKLMNSYLEGNSQVGSISGRGGGTFENIESNAVIVGTASDKYTGNCIGGLLGMANAATVTMKDCEFTGEVYSEGDYAAGLLGVIQGSSKATITDCFVSGSMTSGAGHGAGIVGAITGKSAVTVEDCDVSASVAGAKYTGGICGKVGYYLKDGTKVTENKGSLTVKNSSFTGTVTATDTYAGGMVGYIEQATTKDENYAVKLEGCTFSGTVSSTAASVGGFIGEASKNAIVTITECASSGTVTTNYENGAGKTGGIIGAGGTSAQITINQTSFTGSVNATHSSKGTQVGGMIGLVYQSDVSVTECLMSGNVEGLQHVGGIVGAAQEGGINCTINITDCHIKGTVKSRASGNAISGGLIGYMNDGTNAAIIDATVTRCVLTGTLDNKDSATYKSVLVGQMKNHAKLTCSNGVYYVKDNGQFNVNLDDDDNYLMYQVDSSHSGTVDVSKAKGLTTAQLKDVSATSNAAGLKTVAGTWVAIKEGFPTLRIFAEEDKIVATLQTLAADTTWYTEAADGVGKSKDNPYKIEDAGDLLGLSNLVNDGNSFEGKFFALTKEILYNADAPATKAEWDTYIAEHATDNAIAEFVPIGNKTNSFKGNFDGGGNRIVGIYISATSSAEGTGLFGATDGANIQNLKLENCYIEANGNVGSISGYGSGTFSGIESNAVVVSTGTYAGGMIGFVDENKQVDLNKCISSATVSSTQASVGGIVGEATKYATVNVTECVSSGTLVSTYSGGAGKVGGIIGAGGTSAEITITKTSFTGSANAENASKGTQAGGIIGLAYQSNVTLKECMMSGSVEGLQHVGGMVGAAQENGQANCEIEITDCHIGGTVTSRATGNSISGGLIGYMNDKASNTYKVKADITRCVLTGTLNFIKGKSTVYASVLVGQMINSATLTCSEGVYYVDDSTKLNVNTDTNGEYKIYQVKGTLAGTVNTDGVSGLTADQLTGSDAFDNATALKKVTDDEGNAIWETTSGFPTLRIFAN